MTLIPLIKKSILFLCVFSMLTGVGRADENKSPDHWKEWIGRKVNVNYDCCGLGACKLIIGAKLTTVAEKSVTVITNGAPFLIPRYMIKSMQLSK
jgi:hypothetical protein